MQTNTAFYGQSRFFSQIEPAAAVLAIIGAIVFLFMFGVYGLGREGSYGFDFHVFHQAGEQLLRGENFWRLSAHTASPYSYPPHASIFILIYGALPYGLALAIHTLLNIASLASLSFLANRWFIRIQDIKRLRLAQGLALAVLIGNPFVAHVFFMGQLSLIAIAAVLLSWHFLHTNRWQLSALFLAIATIKPQLSVLYVLWLLVTLQWRIVIAGGLISLVMMIPALLAFGPFDTFVSWFDALAGYSSNFANHIGATHVFGFENAIASLGVSPPALKLIVPAVGLAGLIALYRYRKRLDLTAIISFLFALSVLFIYAHDYDLACLSIMYSFLVILAARHSGLSGLILSMSLLILLFFPQRFVRDIDLPLIVHWRVFVVPLCCYLLLRFDRRMYGRLINDLSARFSLASSLSR